jgi:tryptophan halogenase
MNITILGGGSAGWITALLTQSYYPNHNITVIESDSIGILGAGEGTTPQFIQLLDLIGIPVSDLVKNCGATIKQGINFENWNGDGNSYFHSFISNSSLNLWNTLLITSHLADDLKIDDINFENLTSKNKKVAFSFANVNPLNRNPLASFNSYSQFALHFDARLLAQYFRKVAEERGIVRIEGDLHTIATDEDGNIKQLQLRNDEKVDCDFVFDCSGFARLLIGKFYKTEWFSYEDVLPMDTALPFFIPHNGDVKPQTDAIAMKYGWIWKIPVQGRYGCGYVFDSSYINDEQALQEAEEYFECKLTSPKTFKFKAGTFKETLVNNCMAVGLAQGFVEPLEATSIWLSYVNVNDFLSNDGMFSQSKAFKKTFNERFFRRVDDMKDFLCLHYMTQRNDSPFWRDFNKNKSVSDTVLEKIQLINENQHAFFEHSLFENSSWLQVASGLNLLDNNKFRERMNRFDSRALQEVELFKNNFVNNQENMASICISHKDFLEYLRQN